MDSFLPHKWGRIILPSQIRFAKINMTMRRKSGDRLRWALAYLLLGGVCCVMGVGLAESDATQQQRDAGAAGAGARGEDGALDTDRDPDYFVREDEVPQGLPPLQEEHAYFAALDLDHGVTPHPPVCASCALPCACPHPIHARCTSYPPGLRADNGVNLLTISRLVLVARAQ